MRKVIIRSYFTFVIVLAFLVTLMSALNVSAADVVYLSDIDYDSWAMYEATSEDEVPKYQPSFDMNEAGNTLKIAGFEFEKGIRTHPCANGDWAYIKYDVSSYSFDSFFAVVGRDSAGTGAGKVSFHIKIDDQEVAVSKEVAYGEYDVLNVNIKGAKTLTLCVDPTADGIGNDSAAFGTAVLYNAKTDKTAVSTSIFRSPTKTRLIEGEKITLDGAFAYVRYSDGSGDIIEIKDDMIASSQSLSSTLTRVTAKVKGLTLTFDLTIIPKAVADSVIYLSDIEWQSWIMYGSSSEDETPMYVPNKDQSEEGGKLVIADIEFDKGLRTHPDHNTPADIVYDISKYGFNEFTATVGKVSNTGAGNVVFIVLGDGDELARSPELTIGETYDFNVNIYGYKILTLRVDPTEDGIQFDSAAWGDAMIKKSSVMVKSIELTQLPAKLNYYIGDAVDTSGAKLTVSYSDGSTSSADVTASMVKDFDSASTGKKSATVTYGELTCKFDYEVLPKTTASPIPTQTPKPTASPKPTQTPKPTEALTPTKAPVATNSPAATDKITEGKEENGNTTLFIIIIAAIIIAGGAAAFIIIKKKKK